MPESPIPVVIAMLVCDQIISEEGTNKKSLIGIFDNFTSPQFPVILPQLAVYVKMAEAEGDYEFRLRLVNLKDESLLQEFKFAMKVHDSSQYSDFGMNFKGALRFAEPGTYEFQFYAGDIYLHRITMRAQQSPVPQAGGTPWQQQS